ncbi:hypothetical protein E6H36_00680 [Candidatus Bathyarchaeota archaeon]|nr:MAG: hypothetical protein E6H36_00680 [Candidatus Bathyarchaeota archaeon]TMI29749.1 MAG: hypothetical protein E6H29_10705 [Candidatus Bathyarchaeota archaeon]
MDTEDAVALDAQNKELTDSIIKGDGDRAAKSAIEISHHREHVNDIVDTISDAMNIVADLHEIDPYPVEKMESCEQAAEKALQVIRHKIRIEQSKIVGRVMVTSLKGDPHNFDKTLLMTMLEIGGFTPLDGGTDMEPNEVIRKVAEMRPDVLAIPLVSSSAAKNLLETASLIVAQKPKPHVVAYGRGMAELPLEPGFGAVEEDSLAALSRIAELLIARQ